MTRGSLPVIHIKLLLTAIFWGGTFVAGRVVGKNVGPCSAAFLRFAIASIFFILLLLRINGKLPAVKRNQLIPLILLGMTGVFTYNIFFLKGLQLINAGRASLIIANNPVLITLLSAYFFKEKLNLIKISGVLISVTGAMIVISSGNFTEIFNGGLGWGEFYMFLCVGSWVTFSLIGKSIMANLSPLVSVSYSSVIGTVALFIPAYLEGITENIADYPLDAWLAIFYLGFFGTVLGFFWYYEGIKSVGPMKASQFINFVPISAIVIAFFILGETITPSLAIGAMLVISGVYLTNR
jgi:drug/metabolite transporter (DMT)-like permease